MRGVVPPAVSLGQRPPPPSALPAPVAPPHARRPIAVEAVQLSRAKMCCAILTRTSKLHSRDAGRHRWPTAMSAFRYRHCVHCVHCIRCDGPDSESCKGCGANQANAGISYGFKSVRLGLFAQQAHLMHCRTQCQALALKCERLLAKAFHAPSIAPLGSRSFRASRCAAPPVARGRFHHSETMCANVDKLCQLPTIKVCAQRPPP